MHVPNDEYFHKAQSALTRLNDEASKLYEQNEEQGARIIDLENICKSVLVACGGSENWQGETHEFLKRIEQALDPKDVEDAKAMSLANMEA